MFAQTLHEKYLPVVVDIPVSMKSVISMTHLSRGEWLVEKITFNWTLQLPLLEK